MHATGIFSGALTIGLAASVMVAAAHAEPSPHALDWTPLPEHSYTVLDERAGDEVTLGHDRGMFVIGGTGSSGRNAQDTSQRVSLIATDTASGRSERRSLPDLPRPLAAGSAAILRDTLIVAIDGEPAQWYSLDLADLDASSAAWRAFPAPPQLPKTGGRQCTNADLTSQYDGNETRLYAICWPEDPISYPPTLWIHRPQTGSTHDWEALGPIERAGPDAEALRPASLIGNAVPLGASGITLPARRSCPCPNGPWAMLLYDTILDRWVVEDTPLAHSNQTGPGTGNPLIIAIAGDILVLADAPPSALVWHVQPLPVSKRFGAINMAILIAYLASIVLLGLLFARRNKNTDDYFRGGQNIPWWAAACSIYATMLSSLTYLALPALIYRTDWSILLGTLMIAPITVVAIHWIMPFFRRIDATSAYEYLSLRFNFPVRLFASALFGLFHIGRIGIVLSLTALAMAVITPLAAWQCVLLMGVLSLIYCVAGGIEAVIWTDTLQTVVLTIGALLCLAFLLVGIEGGIAGIMSQNMAGDKFRLAHFDVGPTSLLSMSIGVVVLGGLGQNFASYAADQAVIQRYMVTKSPAAAAKSMWANAGLAIPGGLLFFLIGSGLYFFYRSSPEKLDRAMQLDQIFPVFIVTELPVGIAGLVIAGVFAAAQSTVSTSMNSVAAAIVTDFLRPWQIMRLERHYLRAAQALTLFVGVLGIGVGLAFVSPEIRSLMEAYFKVIGMFMGALGGLFLLGMTSVRANAAGAVTGLAVSAVTMIAVWKMNWANGYLFATIGIISCYGFGYIASRFMPGRKRNLDRLTIHTLTEATGH